MLTEPAPADSANRVNVIRNISAPGFAMLAQKYSSKVLTNLNRPYPPARAHLTAPRPVDGSGRASAPGVPRRSTSPASHAPLARPSFSVASELFQSNCAQCERWTLLRPGGLAGGCHWVGLLGGNHGGKGFRRLAFGECGRKPGNACDRVYGRLLACFTMGAAGNFLSIAKRLWRICGGATPSWAP